MKTVYRSRIDTWVLVVMIAVMAATAYSIWTTLAAGRPGAKFSAVVMGSLALLLPASLLLATHYTLEPGWLRVRSGPFAWRIPVSEITTITPTHDPLASPALSLDRLRIDYGRRSLLISPREQDRFLRDLDALRRAAG